MFIDFTALVTPLTDTSSLNVLEAHLFCVGPHITLASPSGLQALCGQGPAPLPGSPALTPRRPRYSDTSQSTQRAIDEKVFASHREGWQTPVPSHCDTGASGHIYTTSPGLLGPTSSGSHLLSSGYTEIREPVVTSATSDLNQTARWAAASPPAYLYTRQEVVTKEVRRGHRLLPSLTPLFSFVKVEVSVPVHPSLLCPNSNVFFWGHHPLRGVACKQRGCLALHCLTPHLGKGGAGIRGGRSH
ncbi:PREDICTED: uncharacterized protein LOC106725695 [Myotis brandtii]|uniref:uncharacterized protein LOC106725695 n=1 Tax=Myotis brandtii TaxID=109478 RepID=UPI0007040B33|nr:PREDICTED: uncharacterized protein LOC106725695 [Myotis brandtii]